MKKLLLIIICLASCMLTAQAQAPRKVIQTEPQYSDILNVLGLLDINIYRFDLSAFLNEKRTINLYIDEYENNKKKDRIQIWNLGKSQIKDLSVYLRKTSDSTSTITVDVPEVMRASKSIKNRPVGEYKRIFYQSRPFTLTEVVDGDLLTIPLLLYGSGWLDDPVIRFCGEKEKLQEPWLISPILCPQSLSSTHTLISLAV